MSYDPGVPTSGAPPLRGLRAGSDVGGYRLLRRLGAGGMGVVWEAADADGRRVAMKILHPQIAADPVARRRLEREARVLARVRGERVARVLDVETGDGSGEGLDVTFVITELVDGPTLQHEVDREGAYDLGRDAGDLADLAHGLVEALRAVHAAGVIHRDLKPSNVMLGAQGPVLIDFGIAQVADDSRLTQTGQVTGTPGFIPPEMLDGGEPSPQVDWYACAGVLLFAVTGQPPFGSGPWQAVFRRVYAGTPELGGLEGGCPALAQAFTAALAPQADRRLSPDGLLAVLDEVAEGGSGQEALAAALAGAGLAAAAGAAGAASGVGSTPGGGDTTATADVTPNTAVAATQDVSGYGPTYGPGTADPAAPATTTTPAPVPDPTVPAVGPGDLVGAAGAAGTVPDGVTAPAPTSPGAAAPSAPPAVPPVTGAPAVSPPYAPQAPQAYDGYPAPGVVGETSLSLPADAPAPATVPPPVPSAPAEPWPGTSQPPPQPVTAPMPPGTLSAGATPGTAQGSTYPYQPTTVQPPVLSGPPPASPQPPQAPYPQPPYDAPAPAPLPAWAREPGRYPGAMVAVLVLLAVAGRFSAGWVVLAVTLLTLVAGTVGRAQDSLRWTRLSNRAVTPGDRSRMWLATPWYLLRSLVATTFAAASTLVATAPLPYVALRAPELLESPLSFLDPGGRLPFMLALWVAVYTLLLWLIPWGAPARRGGAHLVETVAPTPRARWALVAVVLALSLMLYTLQDSGQVAQQLLEPLLTVW
ncbi:serine/threonine-protein kinase [Actinomyces wuliandei]|uniref:serine/threonine-protein kinase n=1 Tax=Actinomyces wuliandei TaxID=2057743 RepID=UPI000FD6C86D|nr:serine/threonine-protein kinase [Actinomyces wuliandei]